MLSFVKNKMCECVDVICVNKTLYEYFLKQFLYQVSFEVKLYFCLTISLYLYDFLRKSTVLR